jgi:hypothetical protein
MTSTETDSQPLSEADLDEIIEELDCAGTRLPKEAIRRAQQHRDQVVPRLIEVIRRATQEIREGNKPEGDAHFFALFLLTEFRAKEAFPVILEAVSLPGEGPCDLFDDAITSVLARALVTLVDNPAELLEEMIPNAELNEYVRWEAAQAYCCLVREGRMEREEAVERLRRHLCVARDNKDYQITTFLIVVLSSLCPREAYDDIKEAYERDLVEAYFMGLEDIDRAIAEGEAGMREGFDKQGPTFIDDTIEELSSWAAFQEEPKRSWTPSLMPTPQPTPPPRTPDPDLATMRVDPPGTLPPAPQAGRNDPCPCGSGKKFKKCCGSPKARVQ